MGCGSSKQRKICRNCSRPLSPVSRSYSVHVHHPPQGRGDSYHVVALTSTTMGSLKLDTSSVLDHHVLDNMVAEKICHGDFEFACDNEVEDKEKEFSMGLIEAKRWSTMMEEKILKVLPPTPIRTPPGEPEAINTWELMAGLEDISPFRSPTRFRSFSLDITPVEIQDHHDDLVKPKPMGLPLEEEELQLTNFKLISTLRKDKPFDVHSGKNIHGDDVIEFSPNPCGDDKMILYFTSLRGVRKTFEDCCYVRAILKGLGVRIDERDVSMHSGFKQELRELLGDRFSGGSLLPKVFVGQTYIGGAEEIRRMHGQGQLPKLIDCCGDVADGGPVGDGGVCYEKCKEFVMRTK